MRSRDQLYWLMWMLAWDVERVVAGEFVIEASAGVEVWSGLRPEQGLVEKMAVPVQYWQLLLTPIGPLRERCGALQQYFCHPPYHRGVQIPFLEGHARRWIHQLHGIDLDQFPTARCCG